MKKLHITLALTVALASILLIKSSPLASELDDRIESSAKQSYTFKTYLTNDAITVTSKDGVVTLTGTVTDETHKQLAQETVASLPGVKSVDNKLAVTGEVPTPYSDAWVITKVKVTLLFHKSVNALATEVLAKDGAVTLHGQATSTAQKELITEYVKDVDGVKSVTNEMTVASDATKPDSKTMGEKLDAVTSTIDDASITALVKMTLLYHHSTSALNTTVETKDGQVTLSGKAHNAAEKDLATKIALDVRGVKKVVNNMTIAGS